MIQFDIGFKVDAKSLEGQLNTIHNSIQKAFEVDNDTVGIDENLSKAVVQAKNLQNVLEKASTSKGLSFISLNSELHKAGTSATQLVSDLNKGGAIFKDTTNEALIAFSNANRNALTLNKHLQEMGRVFLQSLKFTVAQQAIQGLQNSLRESYEWVVDLDSQLTQIQIVSGKTAQEMEAVSAQIVERSRALRVAAQDYAEASQIYYQQGLQDAEVQRRADITIKAANAANENVKAMSDMLTAVWNTYNMTGDQLENAASVGAKLGAETAIEFRDIAEAMQISATAASQMGVSYNSLASIIATVGSTTRQSASVIGNAYKTIFNNFQRLKVDGENGEVTLKAASQQLQALGINLLDASGQVKELDEVIMQAGQNWKNYSQNEQLAIAQLVGGTRQFGQFLALMNNFDTYLENLNSANMETGAETLEEQYSIAIESIEAKAENASEAWKRAFSNFYDEDGIKTLIDLVGDLGNSANDTIEAFGGLEGIFRIILAIGTTKLPSMIRNITGLVTDFRDSITPGRRQARINSDFDSMINKGRSDTTKSIGEIYDRSGGVLTKAQSNEIALLETGNALWESKLRISKDVALAQESLNNVIRNGSKAQQVQAEMLQQEIQTRQRNVLTIKDELDALSNLSQMKIDTASRSVDNNLKELNGDIYDKSLHTGKDNAITNTNKILNIGQGLGLGESLFELEAMNKQLKESGTFAKGFAQEFESSFKLVTGELNKLKANLNSTSKIMQDFQKIINNPGNVSVKSLESLISQLNAAGISTEELGIDFDQLKQKGTTSLKLTDQQIKNLATSIYQLGDSFTATGERGGLSFSTNLLEVGNILKQISEGSISASAGMLKLEEALKRAAVGGATFGASNQTAITSMTQMASGVQMLTLGFSGLINGIKNGNLNFLTLLSTITMVIPAFQNLVKGAQAFGKTQIALNAAQGLSNVLGGLSTKLTATGLSMTTMGPLGASAGAGLTAMGAGASAASTGLAGMATAGAVGLLPILGIVAAITAAIYALIEVIKYFYNVWKNSTPEEQLKKTKEGLDNLKSATEAATESADNLRKAFEAYTSAEDVLDNCVKGTKEWEDQLRATNQAALDLVNSIDDLSGVDITGLLEREDGRLSINESVMQEIQDQVDRQAQNANYAASLAELGYSQRQNNYRLSQTARQSELNSNSAKMPKVLQGWGLQSAASGGIGIAAVGKLIEESNVSEAFNQISDSLDRFATMTDEEIIAELKNMELGTTATAQELDNYVKSIREVIGANNTLAEKARIVAQQQVDEMFPEATEAEKGLMAEMLTADQKKLQQDILNSELGITDFGDKFKGSASYQSIADEVGNALGMELTAQDNFIADGLLHFTDATGEAVTMTKEQAAQAMAAARALENLEVSSQTVSDILSGLNNDSSLTKFFGSGNLMDSTKTEVEAGMDQIKTAMGTDDIDSNVVKEYFMSQGMEEGLADEQARKYIQQYNNFMENIGKITEDSTSEVAKKFNELTKSTDEMTYAQQVELEHNLSLAAAYGVLDEAVTAFQNGTLDSFITKLTESQDLSVAYDNIQNIINKLEEGSSISEEDYNKLDVASQSYFSKALDGTYKLIGSAEELQRVASEDFISKSLSEQEHQLDRIQSLSQLSQDQDEYTRLTQVASNGDGTYSVSTAEDQVDFLRNYGLDNAEDLIELDRISEKIQNRGNLLASEQEWLADKIHSITGDYDSMGNSINGAIDTLYQLQIQSSLAATSLSQLDQLYATNQNKEAYNQGLINLGSQYENAGAETDKFRQAVENQRYDVGTQEDYETAMSELRGAINIGQGAEQFDLDADSIEAQAQQIADAYDLTAEEASRLSVANQRMQKGFDELNSNWADWKKSLQDNEKTSASYAETLANLTDTIKDLTGASEDLSLSSEFVEENMDDIEAASEGNVDAINRLGIEVAKVQIEDLLPDGGILSNLANGNQEVIDQYEEDFGILKNSVMGFADQLKSEIGNLSMGQSLSDVLPQQDIDNFVNNLNAMAAQTGMSVEQMNSILNSMGVSAELSFKEVEDTQLVQGYTDEYEVSNDETVNIPWVSYSEGVNGGEPQVDVTPVTLPKVTKYSVPSATKEFPVKISVPQIKTENGHADVKYTGTSSTKAGNPSGKVNNSGGGGKKGGGGGGGGKKSTYKKPTPKVRYTNRDNQISRTQQITDKLAQTEDQLYGKAKLAAMQKKSDLIVQQVKDYKALYDEAVAYREQDMKDLAATQLGQAVPMQIDAEGNILNQEEMDDYMREWKDRIDAIEDEGAKEAEQRAYDVSEQAYTYYKEAQEKALEAMKEAVDQLGEWISNEIEKRQYQMEIDIKVSDRQLSLLEFTLEELGSAGWITNWEDGLDNVIDQVDSIMDAGESTIDSTYKLIDLFDKVNNGGLGWDELDQDMKDMFPKDVWEEANENGTQTNEVLEAIGDNTDKLLDYAGQLTEAWVSAWEKIGEAMDSYLEQMERARSPLETQADILETFISVADQVGWDVDKIDKYNELLDKQTDILEANYEASVKQAAATQDALDAMEPVYQDYLERFENGEITGQQFDVIQEQYYNLVDANQDAISQMTSDWSAYVENLQEKFEIAQQQIIKTWNDGIGNMWNDLAESQEGFDLFESLRTWYLDDFNKDYGLTTLTNQIEDAMDSISDPSRLKEYDSFMAEIVAKQEEGYQLSQGELDVLNARFQLMQAQDAYEEAKNNKNTMRLTRDASGNYSYVYSSEDSGNQEQAVLDAQKALHDAEEQYLSDSESQWYEWMLKKYELVTNTDWELYAHDEEYRRQFQLQWDQLTQAMQNATNDVNNALTYTDRTYEETAIHHMTNTESMNQANAQYNEQFQILWDEIQAKYEETDQKVQESASLIIDSNLSLEDAANDLMGTIDETMGNMMDTTDELADNMSSNMQSMIEDTASWSDSIIDEINAVIAKYKELYEMQTNVMQNHTGQTKNYEWHMDGNNGQWYYGDNNGGYYKSGWAQINGKWYFFNDEGYMESGVADEQGNLWVDDGNYRVDSSGAYVGDDAPNAMNPNHTVGDWTEAVDTKNWGANYEDIANGQQNGGLSGNESGYIREYKWGVQNDEHSPGWHWDANEGNWWYATGYEAGQYVKNQTILYKGKRYDFDSNGWLTSDENGYATGGYTGNKGIRGVDSIPAMLAPGEYVLNADDTTKILSAVQLLRGLSSGALAAAANAIAKLANGSIPQTGQTEQIPVQQDVHIEATFPNVSVASEIEDALNNLVNETVQLIGSQNSRRL